MKIALNMGPQDFNERKASQARTLEADILAAKKGDWTATNSLAQQFKPLIRQLAEKRATDVSEINQLMDAGKAGLIAATKRYKPAIGPEGFQIFALDFIESHMDRHSKGGGFLRNLFRR